MYVYVCDRAFWPSLFYSQFPTDSFDSLTSFLSLINQRGFWVRLRYYLLLFPSSQRDVGLCVAIVVANTSSPSNFFYSIKQPRG